MFWRNLTVISPRFFCFFISLPTVLFLFTKEHTKSSLLHSIRVILLYCAYRNRFVFFVIIFFQNLFIFIRICIWLSRRAYMWYSPEGKVLELLQQVFAFVWWRAHHLLKPKLNLQINNRVVETSFVIWKSTTLGKVLTEP